MNVSAGNRQFFILHNGEELVEESKK